MSETTESSDAALLDLLRQGRPKSVSELARATGVTATAVRQRLSRLMAQGLIERTAQRAGRGRPSHHYSLTEKGLRQTGNNYPDLALALWQEIRAVKDSDVRRGLLQRVAARLAGNYAGELRGETTAERMVSLEGLMAEKNVPFQVDASGRLPVLRALACPYPDLAEQDRSVCAMERMLFSEMVGQGLRLSECRLDGAGCCTFEAT